ncbi:MAG: MoxR family ATPase [Nitrososphaeria archaeon]|nr:MoxR family ATPase [Nitrososphaeria archaeon]
MSYNKTIEKIVNEVQKYIVGKQDVIEMMLTALLSEGHILLEGPPGTAKTLMAKTFAQSIGGKFTRIQMTPDTLPADILGTMVYNMKDSKFELKRGPIFSNIILVDELNRAPPKTQAAFLEVMQEKQVSIEGTTYPIEKPFLIIATQMPYGAPGTYPLTEVQTDRFAFKIKIAHPTPEEEVKILEKVDYIEAGQVKQVTAKEEIIDTIEKVKNVHVSEAVKKYIVDITTGLRNNHTLTEGPSVRASIWIMKASRAYALIRNRDYVIPDDVKAVAPHVLRHRLQLRREPYEEIDEDQVIAETLATIPVPKK